MQMTQLVFSPTGGTKRVADALCGALGGPYETVDLSDAARDFSACACTPETLAVIAVPSFGGRIPAVAAERLRMTKGNGAAAVLACVYGNRAYEDTLAELADAAEAAGFRVIAAVAAVAEHSIVRRYAAGRPDEADLAALQGFARQIAQKLAAGESGRPALPGSSPSKKSGGGGLIPKAGRACTACGLCAARCPVGAISQSDPKQTDSAKCISCMRCVAICPAGARSLNRAAVSAVDLFLKKACGTRKGCELFL